MRRIKTTMAAACAALALTATAATAQTVPTDRSTFVTFSGPVSIPGTTLPAGTYTFKLLNSDTNRNVVQIFDKEGVKLYTTLLAVPATRPDATGDPVITFKETPSDRPPAVHYWYYAGDTAGNELVYPKKQAIAIANASGESVMSVDSDSTSIDDWKSGSMSRVNGTSTASSTSATTASTTSSASTASTTSAASTTTASTTSADTTTAQPPAQPTTTASTTSQPTTTASTTSQPTTTASTTSQPTTSMTTQPATATTAQPTTTAEQPAPTPAPTTAAPPPAPTTIPAPAPEAQPVGTSGSLPRTASQLPLVLLIGLLAFAGAVALRAARTS